MSIIHADPLWSAQQAMKELALAEAEKAREEEVQKKKADSEKKALLDRLEKPSGESDDERAEHAAAIIRRAVRNGLTEVEVLRFPNVVCTDHGRAINNGPEPGWEKTLTGVPKELYDFWVRRLQPLGYKIRVGVVDWTGGVPCQIGFILKWGESNHYG